MKILLVRSRISGECKLMFNVAENVSKSMNLNFER